MPSPQHHPSHLDNYHGLLLASSGYSFLPFYTPFPI